jgi:hypothetical protein
MLSSAASAEGQKRWTDLAAESALAPVVGRGPVQQGGSAAQVGVHLLAGTAQQLAGSAVSAHDLDDGLGEAVGEPLELQPVPGHES